MKLSCRVRFPHGPPIYGDSDVVVAFKPVKLAVRDQNPSITPISKENSHAWSRPWRGITGDLDSPPLSDHSMSGL